jgi:endonuclease/exonuclease/phosphatase family metal-dependent hydrolase
MMSYAWVSSKDLSNPIWVAVTHLDHVGETARHEQAKIIAQWVKSLRGPVILIGDFNDNPDSVVHRLLTSPDTGLRDTWQVLGYEDDTSSFTQHDFHGVPRKRRMDWILISPEFRVTGAQIIRDHNGESYPSDHFPYMAHVEVSDQ